MRFKDAMKKVIIIDNYDSFTYILKQYVGELGGNPQVFLNDKITIEEIIELDPSHIILSPGPGTVDQKKDVGIMFEVIESFYQKKPILGVCLGHQALVKFFGEKIVRAPEIRHGKRSFVYHQNTRLFRGIKNPMEVMRYHSLLADKSFWLHSGDLEITAYTQDYLIMAIEHKRDPIFGVQFHPESLGTPEGKKLIRNFLNLE